MKHGFTLLELLIVIVIVAILATLGMTQYSAVIERSRGAEARQILGQLRSVCAGIYMQDGNTSNCDNSHLNINSTAGGNDTIPGNSEPANCRASHYFAYDSTTGSSNAVRVFTAKRCTGNGKKPDATVPRSLSLTTDYGAGGTDTWSNPFGY